MNEEAQQTGALLHVQDLACSYQTGTFKLPFAKHTPKPIVRNISFDVQANQTFALVGESGSGKTTIARAIAGLLIPQRGTLRFQGQNIGLSVEQRPKDLLHQIQFIFQNPDASLNPQRQLLYSLGRPLKIFFQLSGKEQEHRIAQLLNAVHLDASYMYRMPKQLSGGERQRVAIARALAAEPTLILCDEILSALDVSVQANIIDLLRELQQQRNITYLFISHDLAVVRWLAHRVGVLYLGHMMEVGSTETVFSPPFHPYTDMLLRSVPEATPKVATTMGVSSLQIPKPDVVIAQSPTACPFAPRCPQNIEGLCDQQTPPWQYANDSKDHALFCHIPMAQLAQG